MKILLISHWYQPIKSPVKRMVRMAEFLAKKHNVTVLTSLPSYPTGILPKEYRGQLWVKSFENNVKIFRVWDFPTPNMGFIKRTFNHLMFVFSCCVAVLFMPTFDLVIVSSPNFFSGLAGLFARRIGGGKFIFDVRDLWPDSAFELGYKSNGLIKKILKNLEKYYYLRANKIFCATEEIRQTIIEMGTPQNKVVALLNTVNTNIFKPIKINRQKLGLLPQDFIIIYVGSLTQVQNLKTVIEAASILKKYPKIKILMVGEGEDKGNLITAAENAKLKNMSFINSQPTEKIVELINAADLGIISLSKNKFFSDNALPTKTSEYLGCGKPIVACAGKNLKELIEKNQVGIVVAPGDSQMLAKAILELYQNPQKLKKFSQNARQLAIRQFSDDNFYRVLEENLL
ncbi:MAG: Glycosyl transferase, group 1 [Berkelbacteria bacterium GW2011_GWA1_36_9]|uniref:Glycosyl transferase, group 1 n=1 Tax=Berkelbacteria bacterium GW2011_GWA1_36_9 TaxID=1618331 RepID=A0A0G0IRV7_9BACT|nr:MAG: Glycosyl transferase, group 1 [Berkelbacteria bacterium GW2011_GWA1_36_9]